MKRFLIVTTALLFAACGSSTPTSPSTTPANPTSVTFAAVLLPANEVPAVVNADASGSGTVQVRMTLTRDAANTITAATADFTVTLTGFPANTTLTGAHIHPGASGTTGGVIVNTGLANGEVVLASGTTTFSKTGINVPAATASDILNNPAGFYFNVHSTINAGGAARGQLTRSN